MLDGPAVPERLQHFENVVEVVIVGFVLVSVQHKTVAARWAMVLVDTEVTEDLLVSALAGIEVVVDHCSDDGRSSYSHA